MLFFSRIYSFLLLVVVVSSFGQSETDNDMGGFAFRSFGSELAGDGEDCSSDSHCASNKCHHTNKCYVSYNEDCQCSWSGGYYVSACCASGRCAADNGGDGRCQCLQSREAIDCGSDRFCDDYDNYKCKNKRANGADCFRAGHCQSGKCVSTTANRNHGTSFQKCGECDYDSDCDAGEFCDRVLGAYPQCHPQRTRGEACERGTQNAYCASPVSPNAFLGHDSEGLCDQWGRCSECLTYEDCNNDDQYCDRWNYDVPKCVSKKDNTEPCFNTGSGSCQSGHCVTSYCAACTQSTEAADCGSGRYCNTAGVNVCKNKLGKGKACSRKGACQSNKCTFWTCTKP